MNICFIGGGNMATALIGGLLDKGYAGQQIRVVEIDAANLECLKSVYGVVVFEKQSQQAIAGCDVVVLAVKPDQIKNVAIQLGPLLSGQIVLSIAAGIRLKDLARWLPTPNQNYVLARAMPNMPALVGAGMTGICLYSFPPTELLTQQQLRKIETIMGTVGSFVWVHSEEDMDAVTAISGSGPAYFFYFIEALEQAGKELGLPERTAHQLAVETALGAAKLAHESTEGVAMLRARVTSKNGTTERALLSMEANQVKQHIIAAAKAAADRAREMGDELGKE
ncbi:MAG TPA: pyrroline-5-carboxylate reductase [Gallionella sp.]|nr:pyrroline-5-carboxylate reductase [Gallionella sp.]